MFFVIEKILKDKTPQEKKLMFQKKVIDYNSNYKVLSSV
jgi:hypothetical protein